MDKDKEIKSDLEIAKGYVNKHKNAQERGILFDLPLQSYANVMKAKKCYYTGLPLSSNNITIDRVDNSKGYVKGNVVACVLFFNNLKGLLENPNNDYAVEDIIKGLEKINK